MKLTIIFLLFSSLVLLNSSLSIDIVNSWSSKDEKLLKSICSVVNHITRSNDGTQDIMIGYSGDNN